MTRTWIGTRRSPVETAAGHARRSAAIIGALALALPLMGGTATAAADNGPGKATPAHARPGPAQHPVSVHVVAPRRVHRVRQPRPWHRPAASWPAPGAATATLSSSPSAAARSGPHPSAAVPTAGSGRAGTLPVWVGPARVTGSAQASLHAPGALRVRVAVLPHAAARAIGVPGVLFTVQPESDAAAGGRVHVSLDYARFAYEYGGEYGSSLRLVELPTCAVSTPSVAACRVPRQLDSANDPATSQLGANVTLPARTGQIMVMAAASSPQGSTGNFTATPLPSSGTWSEGGSSGAFTYSYPIAVPPVPGGLEPTVALGYDSQEVDGLTSATNSQASWIGDGWDYQPGYIERDYEPCSQDTSLPSSEQTGDLCWTGNNVTTLDLGGQQTTLVYGGSPAAWHAEDDNGAQITYVSGGSLANGTWDDDYWEITEPDGTTYYFGLNELPGYKSGYTTTNSAWTVPVYGPVSGDPCYQKTASTFAGSVCNQAWRWNLDYVTDPHGDAMAYFYNTETNYYGEDGATTGTASYTQAGALSKIWYGFRAGDIYSGSGDAPAGAGEVVFTTTSRPSSDDVPTYLACSSGKSCDVSSPTFWEYYQLQSIATYGLDGSSMDETDSWALDQTWPTTGTTSPPPMWLNSITQTGEDGTAISLPPVTFTGTPLPNRVDTPTDQDDGYPLMDRMRLSQITNMTGGVTVVTYASPGGACSSGSGFPAAEDNSLLCYPSNWHPAPGQTIDDWWNVYVVTGVLEEDTYGGNNFVTSYCYGPLSGNCLTGAAWHYTDDPLVPSSDQTWNVFRGFGQVTTETGASPDPVTATTDWYFQGMNGDYQTSGTPTSATLTSSITGASEPDDNQYAGQVFQQELTDGPGGAMVSDTVTLPWSQQTADVPLTGTNMGDEQAYLLGTQETQTYTALASGGDRESVTTYGHDSYGRVTWQASEPDSTGVDDGPSGGAAEDTCRQTTYATSGSPFLASLDLPSRVTVTDVAPADCPVSLTSPPPESELISDTEYYYDGATSLTTAVKYGNLTEVQQATADTNASPPSETWTPESVMAYDEYGRVTSLRDADSIAGDDGSSDPVTTTAYTPATGAEPTSVKVTDPAGLVTTTTYDPLRDQPLSVDAPGGLTTSATYDSLGRITALWQPGQPEGSDAADEKFSYVMGTATTPSVITTSTINTSGDYTTSEDLYDSLGREVETQTETADGDTQVTDEDYNTAGELTFASAPYWTTGAPTDTLVGAPDTEIPDQTGYIYDGAGRVIKQITYSDTAEQYETDTAYGGNYTTVSNASDTVPVGGTTQTTYTNGLGQTSYIYQYLANGAPATTAGQDSGDQAGSWDQTSYGYAIGGELNSITDAAGNHWSYAYDLAGDRTSASAPDSGTTTATYDPDGNLLSTTDQDSNTISYTYDADGRKTAEYAATTADQSASNELDAWVYDTLMAGQVTSSTSYVGGTSGQYYREQYSGYNLAGQPTGLKTTISSGGSVPAALATTYTTSYGYNAYTGQLSSYEDGAAGGLPEETVDIGYNSANQPASLTSSYAYYVDSLSYTELGQPDEYTYGTSDDPAYTSDTYTPLGQPYQSATSAGTTPETVYDQSYAYDSVGDILSEDDVPSSGSPQDQCFTYNALGQLTAAWSQGTATCGSASQMSQSTESGAAAPYWEQYTYDDEGDLTQEISTPSTGTATTYTNTFSATASNKATLPHAIATQDATGGTTASTSYGYNGDGQTTSIDGTAGDQTLTWGGTGQNPSELTSISDTNGSSTSYIYDASGDLLLQTDNSITTLYLPDEQIVDDDGTLSGTRYYSLGGVTVAARTSSGTVDYLVGDQQGTDSVAINASTLAVTYRYFDPDGNPIGTAPNSWPGTKGFVGGTTDTTTGLTNLGYREYNPATVSFISTDPILNPYDPGDLNPYAYAADNPATLSDPTGLEGSYPLPGGGTCTGTPQACEGAENGGGNAGGGTPGGGSPGSPGCPASEAGCPGYEAPGTNLLPPAVRPAYQRVYLEYKAENDLTGAALEIGALDAFCEGNEFRDYGCGKALTLHILSDYETLAAPMAGALSFIGASGPDALAYDDDSAIRVEVNAKAELSELNEASSEADTDAKPGGFVVSSDGTITVKGTEGFYRSEELQEALENLQTMGQDVGTAVNGAKDIVRPPVTTGTLNPASYPGPYAPPVPPGAVDFSTGIPALIMVGAAIWMGIQNALGGGG
jgi:RHS repeat-associated protein